MRPKILMWIYLDSTAFDQTPTRVLMGNRDSIVTLVDLILLPTEMENTDRSHE